MNIQKNFLQYFFGIKFNSRDSKKAKLYFTALSFKEKGFSSKEIANKLNISKSTVAKWFWTNTIPFEARLYKNFQKLGKPEKNHKWLSINATRGGFLIGPWIQVPKKINSFENIKFVLNQITHLTSSTDLIKLFNLENNELNSIKYSGFYYLLGILLGDGAMCKGNSKRFITRRITLNMTKKYKTNKRICQFTQLCCNLIGLRMKRTKDDSPSKKNKHYFYRWQGQCSQLVNWISSICFELKKDEVKTYSPIKAEWILNSPKKLQISFLQGVADSDGYIDLGTLQAGLISKSSIETIEKILNNLTIHNCRKYQDHGKLAVTMINFKDAYSLPLFNPYIKSYRYKLLEQLNNATRLQHQMPIKLSQEVNKNLITGATSIDIVKMLLNKYNLLVREGSIQKRIRNLKENKEMI
jgi:transcriptional regulator with XRE-family HTH domain